MQFTDTFAEFTQELASRLNVARQAGMSQHEVVQRAEDVGDWLAREVQPRSPEQRLLKEMWGVADNQEQQAIASTLVKLVQRRGNNLQ